MAAPTRCHSPRRCCASHTQARPYAEQWDQDHDKPITERGPRGSGVHQPARLQLIAGGEQHTGYRTGGYGGF